MLCVPDTESPQLPDDLGVLEECGKAFGCFTRRLKDFPAASLHETQVNTLLTTSGQLDDQGNFQAAISSIQPDGTELVHFTANGTIA